MHPAKSVILFTTASGAGYGLLVWLALFGYTGMIEADPVFGLVAFGLAFGLIVTGLLASTFHLGHPERAWRAMSQWKSSWLSREGVVAIVTFVPAGLYATSWVILGENGGEAALVGLIGALLAMATVFCTAMIYASLKTIPAWHNIWTPPAYLVLSLMTGSLLFNMLSVLWSYDLSLAVGWITLILLVVGLILKLTYWRAVAAAKPVSTAGTATGLGAELGHLSRVQLLDPPHGTDNYLMKEMGFRIARKHATKLRTISLIMGFVLPLVMVWSSMNAGVAVAILLATIAVVSGAIGIATERWLFFAEATHVVQLYYGETEI